MIYNIIALIIGGLALLAILFIFGKKFSRLKNIDVNTISEEKEAQVKERILLERMKRHANKGKSVLSKAVKPSGNKVANWFSALSKKIVALEKKYQKESQGGQAKDANSKQTIKFLIDEAVKLKKSDKLSEAEKKYIEAIGSDPHCLEAYEGLFHIYIDQKEYQQALQTQMYILKLHQKESKTITKKDDNGQEYKSISNADVINEDYLHIGEVYQMLDDNKKAFEYFGQAIELIPNDPKTLDALIKCAITLSDKVNALEYHKRLSSVNPENQKLIEYQKKINDM